MGSPEKLRQKLVGWIYPPLCASCDLPLETERQLELPFLCEACEEALTPIGGDYCRICGQSYETQMTSAFGCANCADRELAFDFAVSAYRSCGKARELMHAFKYGKQMHLSRLMGSLIRRVWEDERLKEISSWLVVPVPLHPKRRRSRGFNQSREIAREMIRTLRRTGPRDCEWKLSPLVKRVRHTVRQAQLDRRERLTNPSGAFAWKGGSPDVLPEQAGILLVDDVITTGSTVSECAAVIRQSLDAETVAAVSVLRG